MSDKSGIEWTRGDNGESGATWNPVSGCTRASKGCDNCYAVKQTYRLEKMGQKKKYGGLTILNARGYRHFNGVVRCHEDALTIPMKWKSPRRIFVNSMSDLFHKEVPFEFVDKVFAVMAWCPQHTFQVLTKRPERMAEYLSRENVVESIKMHAGVGGPQPWPLPNVWLGTSCEDQDAADWRIPHLLKCDAAVLFLSLEPLLGMIDLNKSIGGTRWIGGQRGCGQTHRGIGTPECPRKPHHHHDDRCRPGIGWVIIGGESGPGARTCGLGWINDIVATCRQADVPVFVKQVGSKPASGGSMPDRPANRKGGDPAEWPEHLRVREMPHGEPKQ